MSDTETETSDQSHQQEGRKRSGDEQRFCYRIRFRKLGQEYTAGSHVADLSHGDLVITKTEHGPEPALVVCRAASASGPGMTSRGSYVVSRRATREEQEKFARLPLLEQEAFAICNHQIKTLQLSMHLVRVERFFNGSKIIFFFTADSRVDFRELVKHLVQEFRTRVEMRQIGVRHETQMIGGIGACGRELCCSSFLKKFESVSIKMAKAQDLPLNPAKISGVCNRLLCCLSYEYDAYRSMKKGMPRVGRSIRWQGVSYRVLRLMPLQGNVLAVSRDGEEKMFIEEEWRAAEPIHKGGLRKQSAGSAAKKSSGPAKTKTGKGKKKQN
ncbi:MAG: hypothetical protein GQ559_12785 [Desulfobulbaceae bacterium]|nr:hypothetical protein [Desulfobulbaceae bacterium]